MTLYSIRTDFGLAKPPEPALSVLIIVRLVFGLNAAAVEGRDRWVIG